eukprot:TRINITY_DN163_c0_g1_i1.p1 TRINITY_DN163_c0_g1~~TRINITY_DN163_c0_g1_i1.p1  ORF type:complete len:133 (+),score=4.42 TRINITY_DN163_c0_g1_i1:86-484(+)
MCIRDRYQRRVRGTNRRNHEHIATPVPTISRPARQRQREPGAEQSTAAPAAKTGTRKTTVAKATGLVAHTHSGDSCDYQKHTKGPSPPRRRNHRVQGTGDVGRCPRKHVRLRLRRLGKPNVALTLHCYGPRA